TRDEAIRALGRLGADRPDIVATLIGILRGAEVPRRLAAIEALGRVGPAARTAVPALAATFREESDAAAPIHPMTAGWLSHAAAAALGRIGVEDPAARGVLIAALAARAPAARGSAESPARRALAGLALCVARDNGTVPALASALGSDDTALRREI